MNYEEQEAKYAAYGASSRATEDGSWEAPASPYMQQQHSTASFAYLMTPPPTEGQHWNQPSFTTTGYHQSGLNVTTTTATSYSSTPGYYSNFSGHGQHYGHQLPVPGGSSSRGSTNPADYRHYYHSVTSPELGSGTWTSEDRSVAGYSPDLGHEEESFSSSSDEDDQSIKIKTEPFASTSNPSSPVPGSAYADRKYKCLRVAPLTGETCHKAFKRKADLQRHHSCVHDKDKQERIDCPYRKCQRKAESGFLRKDHLTEHLRHFHNKDIPKRNRRASQATREQQEDDVADERRMEEYYPKAAYAAQYGHYMEQ